MSAVRKNSKAEEKEERFIEEPIRTVDGEVRIKKYLQVKLVGSGSYSKCYLVKNTDSESTYVAKIIPKKKLEILQKEKLIYEIKIHQSLSHQNVVHLDHWFEDETNQYIFMEYCPNGNLETKLGEADGNMPEDDIRKYGLQIVEAIAYIHSQNILHRDLKLCNFYLDVNGNVKLGDFGFACQLASEYDKKRETCGTPNYIAPEAISGFGYSFSSDVWAIGVILYRLKYGCCPFEGENVKKTLENVKLCNFKFPAKPKISAELRDLIEKIFNLNYDQRLSTEEILNHEFFQTQPKSPRNDRELKEQKRGFSLSRLFSLDKGKNADKSSKEPKEKSRKDSNKEAEQRGRQGILERESRNPTASVQKKDEPKRSNSCETFKEIKQIFKNKSKQNLATSGSIQAKKESVSSPYYTMNTVACTNRERDLGSSKTNRASIMEYSYSLGFNQTMESNGEKSGAKKEENTRSNRLNQFIKTTVNSTTLKEQLKLSKLNSSKNSINTSTNVSLNTNSKTEAPNQGTCEPVVNSNSVCLGKNPSKAGGLGSNFIGIQKIMKAPSQQQQQLFNYCRKFYLPVSIQQEKDFVIVHYKPSVKQVIYMGTGYILHRSPQGLYKMTGEPVAIADLPKVFKYVIENKVQVKDYEREDEYEYADNDISKVIQYVPQSCLVLKDGVILKYGTYSQVTVAKLFAQEGYYIQDEAAQPLMYALDAEQNPKLLEGVVVMRIYSGWVKTYCKK